MSEIPKWYYAWAADHAVAFGLRDADAEVVLAWGPVFGRLFVEGELRAATGRMLASSAALRWASEHRPAIIAAVEAIRRQATAKVAPSDDPGRCAWCSGSGVRVVPSPGYAEDASPPRLRHALLLPSSDPRGLTRTMGVCCQCPVGSRTREASESASRPMMTFGRYELLYPNWQAVLEEREEILAAGRSPPTAEDRRRLDKLLDQVRKRAA